MPLGATVRRVERPDFAAGAGDVGGRPSVRTGFVDSTIAAALGWSAAGGRVAYRKRNPHCRYDPPSPDMTPTVAESVQSASKHDSPRRHEEHEAANGRRFAQTIVGIHLRVFVVNPCLLPIDRPFASRRTRSGAAHRTRRRTRTQRPVRRDTPPPPPRSPAPVQRYDAGNGRTGGSRRDGGWHSRPSVRR